MNAKRLLLTTFWVASLHFVNAQTTFYNVNTIQSVEVNFNQANWDYQLDTAKYGADGYVLANWVKINGIQYDSVGVKYKGNSSYDSTYIKNPVHIEIDHLLNQSYQGVTDIKLSNCYADPSMIREVLAYDILNNYMHAPTSNFAQLYINGSYIGLYSNDENINKDFCSNHFYSSQNTFFKCNPIVLPGPTTKSNLRYIPAGDSSSYFNYYELKSNSGWNDLVALCDSVTNHGTTMGSIMDIDRVAWMLAFNNLLVNLDSYTGVFCQNYYIYKDNTNHYNPIVWDLNMAFGGFPFVGSGNTSMGSLSIANMQQLNPLAHSTDTYWPMINAVMNNGMSKRMYIAHLRTIANEMFASNLYQTTAAQLQSLIDTAVQSDPNKFYTYTQFQNGMTTDYSVGNYTVPGITNLMAARMSYLQTNTDFTYTPPMISAVQPSNASPALNNIISITALVSNTNTNGVYLGYRSDIAQKFNRVPMFDDGLHNDGAAGDNVYGADFTVSSAVMQYYIYAENVNAGRFAPERAEHEFYIINATIQQIAAGDVVINEFMANNQNIITDANGEFEDWIELHNNLSAPVSLQGCYLTDDAANTLKWAFPQSTVIPANGYLTVWADEDLLQTGLHTNFKLAGSGEQILFSYPTSTIDSVYFTQQTANISYGRCANGSGPFKTMNPSFAAVNNCPLGISETENVTGSMLFPNPANEVLHIRTFNSNINSIKVYDILTHLIADIQLTGSGQYLMDMSKYKNGIYFVQINKEQPVKVVFIH